MGTLFYIPEFLSDSHTRRADLVRTLCITKGWKFVPLDWPSCDPTIIYKNFDKRILRNLNNVNNIFFGTGLGGFWANYFSKDYMGKSLLVNPCLTPSSKLYHTLDVESDIIRNHEGVSFMINEQMIEKYSLYESLIRSHYGTIIYLSMDDPLKNWKATEVIFKNAEDVCLRVFPDGGHVMKKQFVPILRDLEQLMDIPHYLLPHQAKDFREGCLTQK